MAVVRGKRVVIFPNPNISSNYLEEVNRKLANMGFTTLTKDGHVSLSH